MPVRIVHAAPVITLFTMFSMRGHEIDIFKMLLGRPMTIKELQKQSHMSERMLRTYLDDLAKRNFISKKVVEGRRLKYLYYANPPETILNLAKDMISSMEKKRLRMAKDIVRGSKKHIQGGK